MCVRSVTFASGFANAEDFLAGDGLNESAAIVTDIQMPGMSGIEMQERLRALRLRRARHHDYGPL